MPIQIASSIDPQPTLPAQSAGSVAYPGDCLLSVGCRTDNIIHRQDKPIADFRKTELRTN